MQIATEPPTAAEVVLDDGAGVVDGLAWWMRFVGGFYILSAALGVMLLFTAGMLGGLEGFFLNFAIGLPLLGLATAAGMWLRESADQFRRGVATDDVDTMGAGFGTLRKFLILVGVVELLHLSFLLWGWATQ